MTVKKLIQENPFVDIKGCIPWNKGMKKNLSEVK